MAQRVRGTNAAIGNIMEWARRPEWAERVADVLEEHVGDLYEKYGLTSEGALAEALGDCTGMLIGASFEDFLTRAYEDLDQDTIVDEYLRRRGFKETVPGRRYLEGLRDSVMSLYEVLESLPDSHLVLRDLVRGGDVRVEERKGSRQIVKWDRIACRVVPLNRQLVLSGAPLPLEPKRADDLLERLRAALDKADKELADVPELAGIERRQAITELVLSAVAPGFTQAWLEQTLERRRAPLPEIRNTDGEEITFVTTRWPVVGDAAEVARRLDAAEDRHIAPGGDGCSWTWQDEQPLRPAAGGTGLTIGAISAGELNRTSLGSIRLESGELILETNSQRRAQRGRELVESMLGALLGAPQVTRKPLAEMMAEQRENPPPPARSISREDQSALVHEFKTRYYQDWIDQPVPGLDGQTPRKVAQTAEGRTKLVALLKQFEATDQRAARADGVPAFSYDWLWRELGLSPG